MAKSAWYPKATRQDRSGAYPGSSQSQVGIIVLHTTESTGKAGYSGGATAPHLEYHPGTRTWRQFFPITMTSRALANQSGGVQTNRHPAGMVQVEMCGTSGWSKSAKPSWPSVTDPQILGDIAHFLAWMNAEWGTPLTTPMDPWPAWNNYAATNRLSASAWNAVRGIVGHSMVPENDHTDPGAFPIGKVLALANGDGEDDDMKMTDIVPGVKDRKGNPVTVGQALARGTYSYDALFAGWFRDLVNRGVHAYSAIFSTGWLGKQINAIRERVAKLEGPSAAIAGVASLLSTDEPETDLPDTLTAEAAAEAAMEAVDSALRNGAEG